MESGDDEHTLLSGCSSGHDGRLSFNVASGEDIMAEMRRNLGLAADADADTPSGRSEEELGGGDEEGAGADALEKRAGAPPVPSLGSYAHGTGECRPCAFFWKPRGCKDGRNCTHCHLCPQGEIKARRVAKSQVQRLDRRCVVGQEQVRQEEEAWAKTFGELSMEPKKVVVSSLLAPPGPTRGFSPHLTAEGALPPREAGQQQAAPQRFQDDALDDTLSESSSSGEEQLQDDEVDLSGLDFHDRPPQGSISLGSAMHGTGECKPCAWFWKQQGCQNGKDCRHCHLCPLGEIRERKRKSRARRAVGTSPGAPPTSPGAQLLPSEPAQQAQSWAEITGLAAGATPEDSPTASPTAGDATPPAAAAAAAAAALEASATAALEASGLPSAGSAWHSSGLCRPCAWFWKPEGCGNGAKCRHCHICPDGEIKARKKVKMACIKMEENRLRNDASAWMALTGTEPEDFPLAMPPLPPLTMPLLPSMGSALHFSGKCKPCAWFWKAQGCLNGQACAHCHLCPQGELQARMKTKRTAMRMGALVPTAEAADGQRPRLMVKIAPVLSA